ncbi:MAG: tetratricopeptide repeat protein [Rhodocyclales bacterium]|nr:tetratricopeptide repeat protein [Rhodocyclales bacterium]
MTSPSHGSRDLDRAIALNRQGQHYAAIEVLRRILSEDPENADAHSILALALVGAKRIHAAQREAEIGLLLAPESPLAHHAMAWALIAHRRPLEAKSHVEQCLAFDPQDVDALCTQAFIASLDHRVEEQARSLKKAREAEPNNPAVLTACGYFALTQGQVDHAWQDAHAALGVMPEHQEALVLMGRILLRRGDLEGAREHAIWALRQDPSDPGALGLLCSIKARQSWSLGLWWRWQALVGSGGPLRATLLLVGVFLAYQVVSLVLHDANQGQASRLLDVAWLGFVIYTWIAPRKFTQMLARELQQVQLRPGY